MTVEVFETLAMRIFLLIGFAGVALGGCVGGFRNEGSFRGYVSELRLTQMNVDQAARRLTADAFACEANTDPRAHALLSTYCRKSWGGSTTRTYQIWLQPSSDDPNKSIVESSVSTVLS